MRKRLAAFGVEGLERFVRRLVEHAPVLGVVQDAEGRIHFGGLEIGAQEIRAKSVQGGDGGAVEAQHLFAQAFVAARCLFAQTRGQACAHFGGGGAGERDHQHALYVRAFFDERQHALHQNGGLARPCRRAQKQICSPRLNRPALLLSKLHISSPLQRTGV